MVLLYGSVAESRPPGMSDSQIDDHLRVQIDGEILSENSFDERHNFLLGSHVFENTDPLIRERGFRILDKMLDQDPSIKNAYWSRIFTILSEKYRLDAFEEGCERSEFILDFIKWNFNVFFRNSMFTFLRKILDSTRQGFKIAELVWRVIDHGKYKGMIGLDNLIVRDSRNYSFHTDEKGEITPMGVIEGISSTGFQTFVKERYLPRNKFAIYSYNSLDDDAASIYGNSDFRVNWRPFYGDTTVHRHELRSAETFARTPMYGKVPYGEFTKPEQDKIQRDMAGAYNRVYTQIPSGVDVKELGEKRADTNVFQSLAERHAKQVKNGMLMGAQGGDSNQDQVEILTRMMLVSLDAIANDLCENVVMKQIIRPLVDHNFRTEKYPLFSFPKLSVDRNKRAEFMGEIIERGICAPDEPWIRDFLDIPKQDLASRDRQISKKSVDADANTIELSMKNRMRANKVKELFTDYSVAKIFIASEYDNVRQSIVMPKIDREGTGVMVVRESDEGVATLMGAPKEGVDINEIAIKLKETVDEFPLYRFFITKIHGFSESGEMVMSTTDEIVAEPKNRIVLVRQAAS